MIDNWKKVYTNTLGESVIPNAYYSIFGVDINSNGSKNDPYPSRSIVLPVTSYKNYILGNGLFKLHNEVDISGICIIGNDKYTTLLNISTSRVTQQFKDLTVNDNGIDHHFRSPYGRDTTLVGLIVKSEFSISNGSTLKNCLLLNKVTSHANFGTSCSNLTFINQNIIFQDNNKGLLWNGAATQSVFHDCRITITEGSGSSFEHFFALSNCLFKIGNENTFSTLVGINAIEKKNNYKARCDAQNVTYTGIDKIIFSDNSLDDYYRVIKDSEIDLFGVEKGIYFGYEQPESGGIPIKEAITPNSFNNKEGISKGISVSDNLITIADDANIANGVTKQSTLLVFDSIKSIDSLALEYNLPDSVIASTTRNLKKIDIATEKIATATNYLVSSKDANNATVQYNGATYSSDKNENAYIFRGTSEADTLQSTSNNAIIYKVLDYVNTPSIGVRTTNQATRLDVKSGDIRNGYWYYIEKGSINYNGNTYPERSSFLATSEKTFTDLGDAIVDEIFVDDESQNPFVDVFITKPVAAMSSFTKVATGSDGKLVGSAHDEFQMMLNKGYMEASPQGRIIQLKVGITSNIG